MIGFPKKLNSRKDYENIIKDFGYIKDVKRAYQGLLNTSKHYVFDRNLTSEEEPDGNEPEYKVLEEEQEDETMQRVQYKLIENTTGKIFKLGFTIDEVEEVINKC